MLTKIKDAIRGKKVYILGCVAVVTTIVAWACDEVTGGECLAALFVAVQTILLRAGIKKAEWSADPGIDFDEDDNDG